MALIACPECRRQVSDKAAACPNCGHPIAAADHPRELMPDASTVAEHMQNGAGGPTRAEKRASKSAWQAEERVRKRETALAELQAQKKARRAESGGIGKSIFVAAVIGGGLGLYFVLGSPGKDEKKVITGCTSNWRLCADNGDLVNNYLSDHSAQSACKDEAEKLARYGSPKFPWLYFFDTFNRGNDYPRTGIAVLFEKDAQFSNAFGAMVHSTVTCTYDLNQNKVLNVSIAGN